MTEYFLEITQDLFLSVFNNDIFQMFAVLFLFATGLTILNMLQKAV